MIIAVRSRLLGLGPSTSMLLAGKEDHEELARIITAHMEQASRDLQAIDPEAIRARNRKLKQYADVLAAFDEGGKARDDR